MHQSLAMDEQDRVMKVMQLFREDARTDKLDLGVGVYRDADGRTPVMAAIKKAERQLWEVEDSKCYVGLTGARLVTMVLEDEELRATRQSELEGIRTGMLETRNQL